MRAAPFSPSRSASLSDTRTLSVVGRLLSGPTIRQLFLTGRSAYLGAAFRDAGLSTLLGGHTSILDVARHLFSRLRIHYRSDYVYRSAIATKIFLGRHSPATTMLLPELRVWRSKVDLVMLNGTSVAYEIKTELDNLDRLESQLAAYARFFDRIYVVTDERQLSRVKRAVPRFVGLKILTKAYTLRTDREAQSNAAHVDVSTIVDALRRSEVITLTRNLCGSLPQATAVQLFDACKAWLSGVKPRVLHDEMVSILKARKTYSVNDFKTVPPELVSAYLASGLKPSLWPSITAHLTSLSVQALIDAR